MSYKIADGVVFWKQTKLKVAANRFQILHPILAKVEDQIFLGAKAVKVDAASFEVLSNGYARDSNSAFEILATKLKPIKVADANSFVALGETYAKDATNGFFRGRRIAGCDPATLISLHPVFAADAKQFYFTNHKCAAALENIDLKQASIRASVNEVNCPCAILVDSTQAYVLPRWAKVWVSAQGADPTTFEFFGEQDEYQRDKSRVYFRGQLVEGGDPKTVQVVGTGMIRDGAQLWNGLYRLDAPTDATDQDKQEFKTRFGTDLTRCSLSEPLYRDATGVWKINRPDGDAPFEAPRISLLARDAVTTSDVDQTLDAAYRKIFSHLGAVFKILPFHLDYYALPDPVVDLPEFTLQRDGIEIRVVCEGEVVANGPVSMWLSHASALWSKIYKRRDRLCIYPNPRWLPDGDELHVAIAKVAAAELADLATALLAEGHEEEAQVIAHLVLYRGFERAASPEILARVPLSLVTEEVRQDQKWQLESTTNLAVAREIIGTKRLDDPDFRVRYDMLRTLHGVMNDTNKRAIFCKEIIPEILNRIDHEPVGFLREMMVAIIEISLVATFVDSEVGHLHHYRAVEPFIRRQISAGVNTDWNRARLIEALWALGRETEAENERETLLRDCPDDWLAPPRYTNRPHWRNYRLKLMTGRILALWPRAGKGTEAAERHTLLAAELTALRAHFDNPQDWPEFEVLERSLEYFHDSIPNNV